MLVLVFVETFNDDLTSYEFWIHSTFVLAIGRGVMETWLFMPEPVRPRMQHPVFVFHRPAHRYASRCLWTTRSWL